MTVIQLAKTPFGWLTRARGEDAREPLNGTALLLLGSGGMLLAGGLIMILSSSWVAAYEQFGSSFTFFNRQLLWAATGVGALILAMRLPYRMLRVVGYVVLGISIVGLVLVLIPSVGISAYGSSRWLGFGPFRFQPSELAKLGVALVGADLCARKGARLRTFKEIAMPFGALVLFVDALVMLQPDLGTAVIITGIGFAVLFVAGARARVLAGTAAAGIAAAGVLSMSAGYRRARLFAFLNPFDDPLNTGWQALQGRIALGSGGLFGVGLGASRQKWMYVPNAHTDFIFAIIGEEVGLLGTFSVLGLFVLLAYAGVRAARQAPDAFGRIAAGAITAWIMGQATVNLGAVTGLLPITGVPLPLVSFGGSSLLFTLAALGILVNIARQPGPPAPAVARAPRTPRRTRGA